LVKQLRAYAIRRQATFVLKKADSLNVRGAGSMNWNNSCDEKARNVTNVTTPVAARDDQEEVASITVGL